MIGEKMQSAITEKKGVDNPIGKLRKIITQMESDLNWYRANYPESNTAKKAELITQLDNICTTLEQCEPIDVWRVIWDKLNLARLHEFNGDLALVYFPLKPNLPDYATAKQVIIDLCGFNFSNPRDYEYGRGELFQEYAPKNKAYAE